MSSEGLKHTVEAILFASEEELSLKQIKDFLDSGGISVPLKEIESSIKELNEEYVRTGRGFEIIQIAGGYQFATRKQYSEVVGKMKTESMKKKLSQSALETLAIIAYKQPITRSEIEFIRGVNVDYIVNSLLKRDLIMIKGRQSSPGSPILYGTTAHFLKVLGLNEIKDLPKLREINDILRNEKIEGITEADIDLFNSVNFPSEGAVEKPKAQEELNFAVESQLEDVKGLEEDVQGLEEGVQGLEEDVQGLEEDVQGPEEDVQGPEEDVQGPEEDVQGLEEDVQGPEEDVQGDKLNNLENGNGNENK